MRSQTGAGSNAITAAARLRRDRSTKYSLESWNTSVPSPLIHFPVRRIDAAVAPAREEMGSSPIHVYGTAFIVLPNRASGKRNPWDS